MSNNNKDNNGGCFEQILLGLCILLFLILSPIIAFLLIYGLIALIIFLFGVDTVVGIIGIIILICACLGGGTVAVVVFK